MDTSGLRGFASWARVALGREVQARITAVLAPGSTARIEHPGAVTALEQAIASAGGHTPVAERVAYTWFNRIIALRFMDANHYTPTGVVSPGPDTPGQPAILADAKRGLTDADIITGRTRDQVNALLDGTRPSTDPHGEAYARLLADYCRHYHRIMPFMFEPEGDYTELLLPADLLADASVLTAATTTLTPEVCRDVEVIGWLYQFYIAERKDEVFAGFKQNKKAGSSEIPAATQLFTPHWIVRYLVENSIGRLWLLNHPDSALVDQMDYYIPPTDPDPDFLSITRPEELTVIDPACGSGHILTYAFDLLYAIYHEEGYAPADIPTHILKYNLHGTEIDPRAGALAAFALTMKARARQRNFFSKPTQPHICVIEPISFTQEELNFLVTPDGERDEQEAFWNQFEHADVLGSLIETSTDAPRSVAPRGGHNLFEDDVVTRSDQVLRQAAILSGPYTAAIANPPYMDARNMGPVLFEFVQRKFPAAASGLDLVFTLRALDLLHPRGYAALLNMDSWLGNLECSNFRDLIYSQVSPELVLHLGPRAFPEIEGEVVKITASVFRNIPSVGECTMFIDATSGNTSDEKVAQFLSQDRRFLRPAEWFHPFPGNILTPYSAAKAARTIFENAPALNTAAEVRTGLQTGDNSRFLRHWFEVSVSKIHTEPDSTDQWVRYVKSSSPTRWFDREQLVVNWFNNGLAIRGHRSAVVRNADYYFRPGLSYGGLAGRLKVRLVPSGAIFDQKNSMIFPLAGVTAGQLLALLNSSAFEHLARLVSPKGFGVGTLSQLPIPTEALASRVPEEFSERAAEIGALLADQGEASYGFNGLDSMFVNRSTTNSLKSQLEASQEIEIRLRTDLQQIEINNNAYFASALAFGSVDEGVDIEIEPLPTTLRCLSEDLISYSVGCMFGRYSLDEPGLILADEGATLQDYLERVPQPSFMPDADNVIPIVGGDWFEDDIVERFRKFLRAAFGEEHFEANLQFVMETLGVRDIRDYFVKSFYTDHVKRYKNRPIYWLFSSPKGSFNALIYMHRYTPSTVSTVLNEYLREYQAKLRASLESAERSDNAREADRLRKVLVELSEYEHDVLYPLASQNVAIDLDDGVKVNYPKFGVALKKVKGLEESNG